MSSGAAGMSTFLLLWMMISGVDAICENNCGFFNWWGSNGNCNDGGPGAEFSDCDLGALPSHSAGHHDLSVERSPLCCHRIRLHRLWRERPWYQFTQPQPAQPLSAQPQPAQPQPAQPLSAQPQPINRQQLHQHLSLCQRQ